MRVFVTGAGGFLGLATVRALAARGDEVVAFDNIVTPGLRQLAERSPNVSVEAGDITDTVRLCRVFSAGRIDAVVHCAAVVGVVASLANPVHVMRVNIEGAINLFEVMALNGVSRVLHISSEETYGEFLADTVTEDHPLNPIYGYGIAKVAVEHLGRTYKVTHGIECVNLRTSWVYGPDFPRMRIPRDMIEAALEGRPFSIPFGAESRIDHTYVADFVAGTLAALDLATHPFDTYHIASGTAPSVAEIAQLVMELVPGSRIEVGPGVYRHAGATDIPRKGALDCSRAEQAFGYRPAFDIRRGLAAYIESYKA